MNPPDSEPPGYPPELENAIQAMKNRILDLEGQPDVKLRLVQAQQLITAQVTLRDALTENRRLQQKLAACEQTNRHLNELFTHLNTQFLQQQKKMRAQHRLLRSAAPGAIKLPKRGKKRARA